MFQDFSGQTIGPYKLEKLLGAGGMGAVYESYQATVKRKVAIKVLLFQLAQSKEAVERFNREVELTVKLEHPHILPIYEGGVDQHQSYIVMRLLSGGTLDDRIKKHGYLSDYEIMRVLNQIASALDYAHRHGIIHRDIKPSNILFDDDSNAYLSDFGIARAVESPSDLTRGEPIGTANYMAPEQWTGTKVDKHTDIYALGVVAYQLLTGSLPFNAPTRDAMMYKHLNEKPPAPTQLRPNLPTALNQVMEKVLAKDPNHRYTSAMEFYDALNSALGNPTPSSEATVFQHSKLPGQNPTTTRIHNVRTFITQLSQHKQAGIGTLIFVGLVALAGLVLLLLSKANQQETAQQASIISTPTLTQTTIPTTMPTFTPAPGVAQARVTTSRGVIFEKPDPRSRELLTTVEGANLNIIGMTPDGRWYQVEFLGDIGWILADQVSSFGNLVELAVIISPTPSPTFTPSDTPTFTPTFTFTPSDTPTNTPTFTFTPSNTPTFTPSNTPTNTPTSTHTPTNTPTSAPTEIAFGDYSRACRGTFLPPRVRVGERAYVLTDPPLPNSLRSEPSLDSRKLGEIQPGETFEILDGPVCGGNMNWWQVRLGNGRQGWTAEGDNFYWIGPIGETSNLPEGIETSADSSLCPKAPPTTFQIGDTVQVDFNRNGSLPLTTSARGSSDGSDEIMEAHDNDLLLILGGPVCGRSGNRWRWYVRHLDTGIEGWASEAVANDRWMCPLSEPECGY